VRLRRALLALLALALLAREGAAAIRFSHGMPPLAENGHLPPGMHVVRVDEVASTLGGTPRRRELLVRLDRALRALRNSGVARVYIGGSFASAKPDPGDVDMLVPRERGIDWDGVVRVAQRTERQGLHYYGARKIVTDIMRMSMTPAQRRAWSRHKPDFVEFFSQNRRGESIGMIAVDLSSLPR
jgi:hypothetical protein